MHQKVNKWDLKLHFETFLCEKYIWCLISFLFFPDFCRDGMSVNGFSTEDDSRQGHDQICCLIDNGERCNNNAGNASYSKRIQKTVQQRKLKLARDDRVNTFLWILIHHKIKVSPQASFAHFSLPRLLKIQRKLIVCLWRGFNQVKLHFLCVSFQVSDGHSLSLQVAVWTVYMLCMTGMMKLLTAKLFFLGLNL